jgi:threonine/homoserine/homoserine lactone efflux protein
LRAGAAATLGIILGDQVLMWAAAAGVAALLLAWPTLFHLVQYAGAAYLAWIGVKLIRAQPGGSPVVDMSSGRYLRQALLITLLNPKAIVFYMAFFPLFIDPATHRGFVTFAAMAVTIATITAAYCLALCSMAQALAEKLRAHRRLAVALERFAGFALIAFSIRLVSQ